MSHYQSKGDRSEVQQRRIGRPSASAHQRPSGAASTVKGGGAGGPSPSAIAPPPTHNPSSAVQSTLLPTAVSSGRSVKRSNGATGQPTRGTSPAGFDLSDNQRVQRSASPQQQMTQQAQSQSGVYPSKQPPVVTPSSNGAVSRSSRPGTPSSSSNPGSTQPVSTVAKTAGPREVSQSTVHPTHSFQFGSISPSFMQSTGVQIPARTSSCPPILDEQKREQAKFEAASATGGKVVPIPTGGQQQLPSQVLFEPGTTAINKVATVSSAGQGAAPHMRQVSAIPTAGAPQTQMSQSQGHHSLSVQFPQTSAHVQAAQAVVTSQAHLQMQAHYAAAQSQQQGLVQLPLTQTLQSQQGLILQNAGQGMKFPQSMGAPPLAGQMMRPQLNSMTSQLSAQQMAQQMAQASHQIGPQLSGGLSSQISSGLPGVQYGLAATSNIFQPRTSSAVKIVHPETHEELRFDSKSIKGDSFTDNTVPAATVSSTGRLVSNGPPQTRPSLGYVGRAHPHASYYSAHQNGTFTPYYPASMPGKSGVSGSIAGTASGRPSFTPSSQGQGIPLRAPSSQGQAGSVLNQIPTVSTPSTISASSADLGAESSGAGTATVAVVDHNPGGLLTASNQSALNVDAQPLTRIDEKGVKVGKRDDSPGLPSGNVMVVPERNNEAELVPSTTALIKDGNHTDLSAVVSSDVKQASKKKKKKDISSKSDVVNSGETKKQVDMKISDTCIVEAPVVTAPSDANAMVVKAEDEAELKAIDQGDDKSNDDPPGCSSLRSELAVAGSLCMDRVDDKVAGDVLCAKEVSAVNKLDNDVALVSIVAVPLASADASSSDLNHEVSENSISQAHDTDDVVETSSAPELRKDEEQDDDKAAQLNIESVHPLTCNFEQRLDGDSQGATNLGMGDAVESPGPLGISDDGNEFTSPPHESSDAIGDGDHDEEIFKGDGDASCSLAANSISQAVDSSSPAIDSTEASFPPDSMIVPDEIVQVQSNFVPEPAITVKVEPSGGVAGGHPIESVFVAPDVKQGSKKKKMRDILAKADAAGTTADLYNAYKAPEEKKPDDMRVVEVIDAKVSSTDEVKPLSMPEYKAPPRELDDWEDAAELPSPDVTTGLVSTAAESSGTSEKRTLESAGREKYTRDFLLTFRGSNRELPIGFEIRADIAELLMSPQAVFSPSAERDALSAPGRLLDRQLSGGSRRSSNFDEDRWTRQYMNLHSPGRAEAVHADVGPGSFRPGSSQGLIARMPSNVRSGIPIPPVGMGLIPGKPLMSPVTPISSGAVKSNSVDADRWQHMPAGPKGLIAPLQTPSPAMHKAEKRYETGKASDEEELKQRQIKGILNKLTPQNFDKLFAQVKDVNIASANTLKGVISQIFDKALSEPTFCEMYAKFCVQLAVALPEFTEDGDKVTFKRVLLNNCQEEFLRGEKEQAEVDSVEEDGVVKLTVEEREEKRIKAKRRMLGNIRFIGELYKKSMLTERIMHECIQKLLGEFDIPEEDVEALCKLMSTIGRMIDHPKAKEYMESYFDRMTKLSNDQKLPARLRFMLKDVIDLRRNGWQERRKVEGPKKIEEVHRDAVHERQSTGTQSGRLSRGSSTAGSSGRRLVPPPELAVRSSVSPLYSPSTPMGNVPSVGGIRGSQSQIGIRGSYGQDVRNEDRLLLENRSMPMPLSQRSAEEGPITLGPQGGLGRGMALRGQPLGSGRSALLDASPTTNLSDGRRFASGVLPPYSSGMVQDRGGLFGVRDEVSHRGVGAERPLTPSEGPLLERPVALDRYGSTSSTRGSRSLERTLSDRSISSSMASTAPQQQGLSSRPSTAPALLPLSEDQLRHKSESAVIEYFSARDLKEAAQCVEDLRAPKFHSTMVFLWVSISLERKDLERELLVKLLISLFKMEPVLLKQDQVFRGIEMVMQSLEDLMVDAPKAPEFLAVMIEKLITAGVISLVQAGKLLKADDVLQSGHAFDMLGRILEGLRQEIGEPGMLDLYRSSGIHLEEFVGSNDSQRKRFDVILQERNLQCLYPMNIIME